MKTIRSDCSSYELSSVHLGGQYTKQMHEVYKGFPKSFCGYNTDRGVSDAVVQKHLARLSVYGMIYDKSSKS